MNTTKHKRNRTHDWAVLLPLALPPDLPPVISMFESENRVFEFVCAMSVLWVVKVSVDLIRMLRMVE